MSLVQEKVKIINGFYQQPARLQLMITLHQFAKLGNNPLAFI